MSVMVLYDAALRNIPNHHSDYFGVSIGGGDGDVSGGGRVVVCAVFFF